MRRIDEKDLIEMASEANQIESDNSTAEINNFKILQGGLSIAKKLESFFLNAYSFFRLKEIENSEGKIAYLCNMKFTKIL